MQTLLVIAANRRLHSPSIPASIIVQRSWKFGKHLLTGYYELPSSVIHMTVVDKGELLSFDAFVNINLGITGNRMYPWITFFQQFVDAMQIFIFHAMTNSCCGWRRIRLTLTGLPHVQKFWSSPLAVQFRPQWSDHLQLRPTAPESVDVGRWESSEMNRRSCKTAFRLFCRPPCQAILGQ